MKLDFDPSEVVFLLGAGSSIAASVPDTYTFVKEFTSSLEKSDVEKYNTVKKILEILRNEQGKKTGDNHDVDVELLLETLVKLEDRKQEQLLKFFESSKYLLKESPSIDSIIKSLKDFIKKKSIVDLRNVKYLTPILEYIEESDIPLDIISVNYDTCIEQFCNIHKLVYKDGFNVYWEPSGFESLESDVRLYKLHGSVMWYSTDRNTYIKVPVLTSESEIELITKERARSLMIYPMRKWEYAEPLLELLIIIKKILESEKCKFLIVAGYSFRDEHITRILWDAAAKNRELKILLVDPNAYGIYHKRLQYSAPDIVSPLNNRVINLPYKFEEILPALKNYYLKNLREALNTESTLHSNEIKGNPVNWYESLMPYASIEYYDRLDYIIQNKNANIDELDLEQQLDLCARLFINLYINRRKDESLLFHNMFVDRLKVVLFDRLKIDQITTQMRIAICFDYQIRKTGYYCCVIENLVKKLLEIIRFITVRIQWILNDNLELSLAKFNKNIGKIVEYLNPWSDRSGWAMGEYLASRKGYISDEQERILQNIKPDMDFKEWNPRDREVIIKTLETIEKNYVKSVIDNFEEISLQPMK